MTRCSDCPHAKIGPTAGQNQDQGRGCLDILVCRSLADRLPFLRFDRAIGHGESPSLACNLHGRSPLSVPDGYSGCTRSYGHEGGSGVSGWSSELLLGIEHVTAMIQPLLRDYQVLPQLWAMSMGPRMSTPCKPCISIRKFMFKFTDRSTKRRSIRQIHEVSLDGVRMNRFELIVRPRSVIKSLGNRVEREHSEHLRAIRRADEQTSSFAGASTTTESGFGMNNGGEVDFAALVGSNTGAGRSNGTRGVHALSLDDPWDRTDDWLASAPATTNARHANVYTPTASTSSSSTSAVRPKARPVPASTFNAAAFAAEPIAARPNNGVGNMNGMMQSTPALAPSQVQISRAPLSPRPAGPNYDISLAPQAPTMPTFNNQGANMMAARPLALNPSTTPGWPNSSGMSMGGMLQPTKKVEQGSNKKTFNDADWGDFDPLK